MGPTDHPKALPTAAVWCDAPQHFRGGVQLGSHTKAVCTVSAQWPWLALGLEPSEPNHSLLPQVPCHAEQCSARQAGVAGHSVTLDADAPSPCLGDA